MTRPRVRSMPDSNDWVTLRRASDITGYCYDYIRKLVCEADAPQAICFKGKLYVRKAEVLTKWGGLAYATAEEAVSRRDDA